MARATGAITVSLLTCLSLVQAVPKFRENPEVYMNVPQLITSKGYPCENHWVTTRDGYILNLQRIPHGVTPRKFEAGPQPVALLQHGLLSSAADFVLNPQNESIAFLLADAGVDVWLGNARGNSYSRNHTSLDPKTYAFWDFRLDDLVHYDLPAMINYVSSKTGSDQLTYVGYSQGSYMGFAAFSEDKELSKKVKQFVAFAPIARVGHITSPIRLLAPIAYDVQAFLDLFGHGAVDFDPKLLELMAGAMCRWYGRAICENALFVVCGYDPQSFNASRVDVYTSHLPSPTSARNLMQWAQGVNSQKFQRFDWGSETKNREHYGQPTPPEYYPGNVTVPVILVRGGNDILSDHTDIEWLMDQLTTVTKDYYVSRYDHLDVALAFDAPQTIYKDIVPIIAGQ